MPLKYKVGDTIVGRCTALKGLQGSVIAIVKEGNTSKYKVWFSTGVERILTARSICTPHEFAALSRPSPAPSSKRFSNSFP